MKKKILKYLFSIVASFGITVLIIFGLMLLLVEGYEAEEETAITIIAFVMGTFAFSVLILKIHDYLISQ